jgi:hypothetical protein
MAQTALVDQDIEAGRQFVRLLDMIGIKAHAAFWLYRSDTERWRLVIVCDEAEKGSRDLYLRTIKAGSTMELGMVEFQPTSSRFYKHLIQEVHIEGSVEKRIHNCAFNGIYIEDALIYRLSAA